MIGPEGAGSLLDDLRRPLAYPDPRPSGVALVKPGLPVVALQATPVDGWAKIG